MSDHGGLLTTCLTPSALLQLVVDDHTIHQHQLRAIAAKQQQQQQHSDISYSTDENDFLATVQLTPSMFVELCPALLMQLDTHACSDIVKKKSISGGNTSQTNLFMGK